MARSGARFRNRGTRRMTTQHFRLGKTSLALFFAACCLCPPSASAAPGLAKAVAKPTRTSRHHRYVPREKGVDPTLGDVDPNTGRILTVVNQKLAYSDGAIPC